MANVDNPNGFTPFSPNPRITAYNAKGTFAKGDLLKYGTGGVVIHSGGDKAVGVAAHAANDGETVLVYDDPDTIFIGQCEGTHDADTHDGVLGFDVSGATGEMEINQGSASDKTVVILRQEFVPGHNETGAHARVIFQIAEHHLSGHLTA